MKQLVITLFTLLLMPVMVSAASVSPSLVEIVLERGSLTEDAISVINTSGIDQTYYLDVIEFTARDEGGEPQFIPTGESTADYLEWFTFDSEVVVVPAESAADIPFEVRVPQDVTSGGYYAAITVSPAPEDVVASNGAIIEAKTAVLVLLTVAGETTEKASLLDFTSETPAALLSTLDIDFQYRVQNQGNVHILPAGEVVVTDFLGREISRVDANQSGGRVLPGSTRTYRGSISSGEHASWYELVNYQAQHFSIGPVTALLNVSYGDGDDMVNAEFTFWLFPWQLILTVFAAAALLLIVYKFGARASRRTHKT